MVQKRTHRQQKSRHEEPPLRRHLRGVDVEHLIKTKALWDSAGLHDDENTGERSSEKSYEPSRIATVGQLGIYLCC